MPNDSFEGNSSSENRNAILKTCNWHKSLEYSKAQNQFQVCCQCSPWVC